MSIRSSTPISRRRMLALLGWSSAGVALAACAPQAAPPAAAPTEAPAAAEPTESGGEQAPAME
jgi:hypothetical protein